MESNLALDPNGRGHRDGTAQGFVTRFAPSPTGLMHLGNAFSALTAFDTARAASGRFLLRIEDLDTTRCRPEFEAAILTDLAWLGIDWDEAPLRQSSRFEWYEAVLQSLRSRALLYRCFKTRKEMAQAMTRAPHSFSAPFTASQLPADEEATLLAKGKPFAWRLSLDRCRTALGDAYGALRFFEAGKGPNGETGWISAQPERIGDVALARKEIGFSYHLASCCDDAHSGVSHVIRGCDLHEAAHVHCLLQALMGWPTPIYVSHRLIHGVHGRRLAKRDRAATLQHLRETGADPELIRAILRLRGGDRA